MRHSVLDRSDGVLDRMKRASDKVEDRLDKAVTALENERVPYAVVGGLAVAAWVATVDEGAVRGTRDVDVLLSPADLDRARVALEKVGSTYRHSGGIDRFLDTPESRAADSVHVVLSGGLNALDPSVDETVSLGGVRYIPLLDLVKVKLSVWRDKDRVHVRDMIGVGLVDASWLSSLPPLLAERLSELLANPEG